MSPRWEGTLRKIDDYRWEIPQDYKPGMKVPGLVYASEAMLETIREEQSLEQVANVSFLPGIVSHSLAMPDIHWGYGFPIGGVAATRMRDGVISPGGVGFDINCGVRLLCTNLTAEEVKPRIEVLTSALFSNIPSGLGSRGKIRVSKKEMDEVLTKGARWAVEHGFGTASDLDVIEDKGCIEDVNVAQVSIKAKERGMPQLGTLGSGNHFLEIGEVQAGGAAALRGMRILGNSGLSVRVSLFSEGDDPDSLVRRDGGDAMRSAIDNAVPFYRFYVQSLGAKYDPSTVVGKERALAEARGFASGIRSLPLREEFARELADLLDLPRDAVARELSRRIGKEREERPVTEGRKWEPEEDLLVLLLRGDIRWDRFGGILSPDHFSEENRPIAEGLAAGIEPSELVEKLDEESARRVSFYALAPVRFSDIDRAVDDAVERLVKLPAIDGRLTEIDAEMKECEERGDLDRWNELTREKIKLLTDKLSRRGSDDKEEERS